MERTKRRGFHAGGGAHIRAPRGIEPLNLPPAGRPPGGIRAESPAPAPITIDSAHSSYTMIPLPTHGSDHTRHGAAETRHTAVKTLRPCLFLSMMISFFFVCFIFFADLITAFIFRYANGSIFSW